MQLVELQSHRNAVTRDGDSPLIKKSGIKITNNKFKLETILFLSKRDPDILVLYC